MLLNSQKAGYDGHEACEFCRIGIVVWGDLQDKWLKSNLTIPDLLFLKNRQRNSEEAPKRRASMLSFNERQDRERKLRRVFSTQTPIGSGTVASANWATISASSNPPISSASPGTVTPTSPAAATSTNGAIKRTSPTFQMGSRSPRLSKSSGSQTLAMSPGNLAMNTARVRVATPTSSGARTLTSPGFRVNPEIATSYGTATGSEIATNSEVTLQSEVPMSSSSDVVPMGAYVEENLDVTSMGEDPKAPRLGIRVWSRDKYMRTN